MTAAPRIVRDLPHAYWFSKTVSESDVYTKHCLLTCEFTGFHA